jgi:hypothetical protein
MFRRITNPAERGITNPAERGDDKIIDIMYVFSLINFLADMGKS